MTAEPQSSTNIRPLRPELAHALDAEQAVLGAMFLEHAAYLAVRDLLSADDFFSRAHQFVYGTCCELVEDGRPIDPVLVLERLDANGHIGRDVPADMPFTLATGLGTAGNVVHYANVVAETARVRRVQLAAQSVLDRSRDATKDPGAFLQYAKDHLAKVTEASGGPPPPDVFRELLRASASRFTAEQLRDAPPPLEYIAFPYIPRRKVITLAGPGGSNKTTLLTYLAVCRALGRSFYGRVTPARGKTVILTTEDGADDYWRRLAAIRHEIGDEFDEQAVADAITVFDLAGEDVRLIDSDHGMFSVSPFVDHFAAVLKERAPGADLVICETVSRLTCGIETNESLTVLVRAAERVCKLADVAMLLVSHVSQEAGRLGLADQYAARGGSALGDNGRSTMILTRINDKNRKEFLPDAELTRKQMQDLLILTHPKSIGPKAEELLLERRSTPHGPVLAPAAVKPREDNRAELRAKLVALVAKHAQSGEPLSPNGVEDYKAELGCSRADVRKLIRDALMKNELARRSNPHGKGHILVPARDPGPPTPAADPGGPSTPDLFSARGGTGAA